MSLRKRNRNTPLCLLLLCSLTLAMTGISCGSKGDPQEPIQAYVLKMDALPPSAPSSTAPTYSLQKVTFPTIRDPRTGSGSLFKLVEGSKIRVQSLYGSILAIDQAEGGGAPSLHYDLKDQVIIPKDYDTLAKLSILYQFDVVVSQLQKICGIHPDSLKPKKGVFEIHFEPTSVLDHQTDEGHYREKLNAAYAPRYDLFLFYRRSPQERLPITSNLQVIAHEFGHAVFERVFGNRKTTSASSFDALLDEYDMIGINEGFADFFSYTLTGSTNMLENTFGKSKGGMRNFSTIRFNYLDLKISHPSLEPVCSGDYYCIGTLFAKSLFDVQKQLGLRLDDFGHRRRFFQEIVRAMTKARPSLDDFLANHSGEPILGAFLGILVSQIESTPLKSELRNAFLHHFTGEGFPERFWRMNSE